MLAVLDDIFSLGANVLPHSGAGGMVAFAGLAVILILGAILLGFSKHVPENLRDAAVFVIIFAFVAFIFH